MRPLRSALLNSSVRCSGSRSANTRPTALAKCATSPIGVLPSIGTTMWKPFEPVVLIQVGRSAPRADREAPSGPADRCGIVGRRIEIEHAEVRTFEVWNP